MYKYEKGREGNKGVHYCIYNRAVIFLFRKDQYCQVFSI